MQRVEGKTRKKQKKIVMHKQVGKSEHFFPLLFFFPHCYTYYCFRLREKKIYKKKIIYWSDFFFIDNLLE